MPRRVFRNAAGVEWQVWSVIPGSVQGDERRHGYDRRSPDPVIRYKGPERRTSGDRRRQQHSAVLPTSGWLVFDSVEERRRLTPIPPAWESRPDLDLERFCERAVRVPKSN
ncbi:MAG TPA: hypothetical protein VJT67_06685 [Longimicrobiaceae bacterium]|nr:hypothetical protein [Longimicrobiaceae bacterium]